MLCTRCGSAEFAIDKQAEMLYDHNHKQIGLIYHCNRYCRHCGNTLEKWTENAQGNRI